MISIYSRKRSLLIGILSYLISFSSLSFASSNEKFITRIFSENEGLLNTNVECLLTDDDQTVWIGTQDGLYHYNGDVFRVFKPEKNNPSSIDNIRIRCLLKDHAGNIWIGTETGLNVFSKITGKITRVISNNKNTSESCKIFCLMQDKKNRIWAGGNIGKNKGSLIITDVNTLKTQFISLETNKDIVTLATSSNGNILAGSALEGDLFIISSDNLTSGKIQQIRKLPYEKLQKISVINGKIWLSGYGGGLSCFDEKELDKGVVTAEIVPGTEKMYLHDIEFDEKSRKIWMADINSCIVLYDPVSKMLEKSRLVIPENIIPMNVAFGYNGEIWIGSQKGLISVRNENTPFKVLVNTEASEEINPFISIFIDKSKHLWSSRYFKNKTFTDNKDYDAVLSKIAGSKSERIWDFTEDEKYYFVLSSGKINQIEKGSFRSTEILSTSKIDNPSCEFLSMHIWKDYLLVGTTLNGLFAFQMKAPYHLVFSNQSPKFSEISKNGVHGFTPIDENWILIWTDNGLWIMDKEFNLSKKLHTNEFSGKFVAGVDIDQNNFLWIAYYGGGLDVFSNIFGVLTKNEKPQVLNFNESCGLKTGAGMGMMIDKNNLGWLSTTNGLYRIILTDKIRSLLSKKNADISAISIRERNACVKGYFNTDGLIDNDFSVFCAARTEKKDRLYFASAKGIIYFNPDDFKQDTIVSDLILTGMKIFDKEIETDSILAIKKIIHLNYKQNFFSFDFDFKYYRQAPSKHQYAYQMVGFDNDWIYSGNRRFAQYTNLGPGEYTFLIKGANEDGIWVKKPYVLKIVIHPPFWRTNWFYAATLLTIIIAIFSIIRYREIRLRRENKLLEEKVAIRTEEIEEINIVLTKKNRDITDSINYARRMQDSILPPVSDLQKIFPSSFVIYKPKDIVSGDFYWFKQVSNEKNQSSSVFIAIADCTGHGVPGALMSMIGVDRLSEGIKLFDHPSNVLEYINHSVKNTLRQHDNDDMHSRDGMDMALLAITEKEKGIFSIEFAGANRPLWYFNQQEILQEVPSDKVAIAGFTKKDFSFRNHSLIMQKGQRIYLFSDGIYDQFGGKDGQKLLMRGFRELIQKAQVLPLHQQAAFIEKELKTWQNSYEQVDDILIMGIEL
ncbi:MAG: SpoIIE family protein phosphatase [Bacteroidota bacterium]